MHSEAPEGHSQARLLQSALGTPTMQAFLPGNREAQINAVLELMARVSASGGLWQHGGQIYIRCPP